MTRFLKNSLTYLTLVTAIGAFSSCEKESPVEVYSKKNILLLGNGTEPQGLDPHVVTGVPESYILRSLFEGLCMDHPTIPGESSPGAAASWNSNEDSTKWIFNLQPEGKWSDGQPVTAEDFVFSYHRILHPDFGAQYASMLYFIKGAEDYNKNHRELYLFKNNPASILKWDEIKEVNFRGDSSIKTTKYIQTLFSDLKEPGKKIMLNATGLNNLDKEQLNAVMSNHNLFKWPTTLTASTKNSILKTLITNCDKDLWTIANVGVSAIDDLTLKLELKSPTPFLPDITKHYTWYPVPKHIITAQGPFTEQNYLWTEPENIQSNGPFKMKEWKLNHYIQVEQNPFYWDAKSLKLEGLRFLPVGDTYTEARMFFNGQLHATNTLAAELIQHSQRKHPKSVRQETYLGTNFLRINNNVEDLKDINIRKALAYSIDSKSIIDHILKGGQKPASGLVPPMGKYQPAEVYKFDPELAKELFAKTKFASNPSKLKITILTTDKDAAKALAEALQNMWKSNLGITVTIKQNEWKTYLSKMSKLDYTIATGGWIGDYPDPTTFLDMWKKGDGNNRTGWSSEAFETQLDKAATIADPELRIEALKKAEMLILQDMPIIPLYWYTSNYLLHESVKGWEPSIMKNQPYKYMYLQK